MTGNTLTMDDVIRGALRAARAAWARPVYDAPKDYDWIAQMHREAGLGWTLEDGETPPRTYFGAGLELESGGRIWHLPVRPDKQPDLVELAAEFGCLLYPNTSIPAALDQADLSLATTDEPAP